MSDKTPSTEETPATAQTVTAADLNVTPPMPTEHVAALQQQTAPDAAPQAPAQPAAAPEPRPQLPPKTDRAGTPFDPERHIEKMHPKSGRWMPKKPKRPDLQSKIGSARPRSIVAPDVPAAPIQAPAPEPEQLQADPFRVAAVGACTVMYSIGMTIGGDEWRPTDDENENLVNSFEAYFRVKGITDLSPGWALAIAVVAYAGPRFRGPKTVSTLQRVGGWFGRVAAWWKARSVVKHIPGS